MSESSQVISMHQTDEAIMVAVRQGEIDQLEILFQRYRDPLYDLFSRLTGNRVISIQRLYPSSPYCGILFS